MSSAESYTVQVYIYDQSKGLAKSLSQSLIGQQIDGLWHTGIVVYGKEYFFDEHSGILSCNPSGTGFGPPDEIVEVGQTEIPPDVFMEFLKELSASTFRPERYHLLDHNCNTFSNEVAQFLTGKSIPSHITSLPQDVLNTPFGAMIRQYVEAKRAQGDHSLFPAPGNASAGSGGGGHS